jgi:hypothetical protein
MSDAAIDFVLSGQAVLPLVLWGGTASMEVFAVASLISITLTLLTLSASTPIPPPPP